jgi:hypothetical protein
MLISSSTTSEVEAHSSLEPGGLLLLENLRQHTRASAAKEVAGAEVKFESAAPD